MKKILLLGIALTLLLVACGEEEGVTEPEPENTPVNVIEALDIAFNQRTVEYLKSALAPDFCFYFDPDDVGENPPGSSYVIPEHWSYAEFRSYAQSLFERAHTVAISIPTGTIGVPRAGETTFKAENVNVTLFVMVDERNGFLSDRGYCDFEFGTYYTTSGRRLWRLAKWEDYTSVAGDSHGSPASASLGKILAMYK